MKVKISFISDLHTRHWPWEMKMFEKGMLTEFHNSDIVVFCGDMSSRGYKHEVENFLAWFNDIPNAKKIFIAGNHDFFFDTTWFSRTDRGALRHMRENNLADKDVKEVLEKYPDIVYLQDSGFEHLGIKFWGSPITPWFHDWAFNRWEDEIEQYWTMVPDNIDVLLTHGPAFGIVDLLHPQFRRHNEKDNVGCPILLQEIQERIKPLVHACGHIHEAYGIYPVVENPDETPETLFINASCLDQDYRPVNPPITIEIDTETRKVRVI
jgi:Icc-related predicted phosphoesterase